MDSANNNDVFFSRGHGVEKFPGNMKYRVLIAQYAPTYKASASNNKDKQKIASSIISTVRCRGGTFYHQPKGSEGFVWEALEIKALQKKIKQSLRDSKAPGSCSASPKDESFTCPKKIEQSLRDSKASGSCSFPRGSFTCPQDFEYSDDEEDTKGINCDEHNYDEEPSCITTITTTTSFRRAEYEKTRTMNNFQSYYDLTNNVDHSQEHDPLTVQSNNVLNHYEESHEYNPFQDCSHGNNYSTDEKNSCPLQSSVLSYDDMMHESIGTITGGMQSISMMDFNFSQSKGMSFRQLMM